MLIGIIGATTKEIRSLHDSLSKSRSYKRADFDIYSGYLHETPVLLMRSGVGKVCAAIGTTILLDRFKSDLIINIGSAGSLSLKLNIGDIVLPHQICYHDVNVTAFGYQIGQMVGCPSVFNVDLLLIKLATEASSLLGIYSTQGLMISGDSFINGKKDLFYIKNIFPKAIAVEMEAAAIAQVCFLFMVPFLIVRSISDIADKNSHTDFQRSINYAAQNLLSSG